MSLPAKDVVLHPEASRALESLDRDPDSRKRSVAGRARALRPLLLVDCLDGEVVTKRAIPGSLVTRFGIENLYMEDLPDFWRLTYTVVKEKGERYVVVVAILDHRSYDRLFRKRGRQCIEPR